MIISSVELYRFQIPLNPHLPVGKQRIDTRCGLVLAIDVVTEVAQEQQKLSKQVEITPLSGTDIEGTPLRGFSHESLEQVQLFLVKHLTSLQGQPIAALLELIDKSGYPSIDFALSYLYADLNQQLYPHQLLDEPTVPLLYPIEGESQQQLIYRMPSIDKTTKHNVRRVKLKVAQATMEDEIKLLHQLLAIDPQLQFRLDANRGFTLDQALTFAASLPLPSIEYIEEPCQTIEENITLYKMIKLPWALDESLNSADYQFKMYPGLAALIVKPTLLGSLAQLQTLQTEAQHHGVRVILSSALEAHLGIEAIARVSKTLTPDEIPGLDTLSAFTQELMSNNTKRPTLLLKDLKPIYQSNKS